MTRLFFFVVSLPDKEF